MLPDPSISEQLEQFARECLISKMTAGKILSQETEITFSEEASALHGNYVCQEMICRVRKEQIGE